MTIKEIEAAVKAGHTPDITHHDIEVLDLPFTGTFYPLGFPMIVQTNCERVLELAFEKFKVFAKQHDTEPVILKFRVTEGDSSECPPDFVHRFMWPLRLSISDSDNYMIFEKGQNRTHVSVTRGAMQHEDYINEILGGISGAHLVVGQITPIHAACLEFEGGGILLCGDSGAGKSTLAYACTHQGWAYVSDDASFLVNHEVGRTIVGNCYQVRFRPQTAELFPELKGHEIVIRGSRKPSIELPTSLFPHMVCKQRTQVKVIVFLNRNADGAHELVPYDKDVANYALRQGIYGTTESKALSNQAIDRLLGLDVFELRYTDLNWASDRLKLLVREGK